VEESPERLAAGFRRLLETRMMTCPVLLEPCDGQFAAALVGLPSVRAVAPTRDEAIRALKRCIEQRIERGDLLFIELPPAGLSSLAGKYSGDPVLREICDDAYKARDAEQRE
jgi:predicted RNase H-like HicB family nuclease